MGKGEFAYYKLEFSDFETIKESMPADQGMTLLSAIVEYAKSGEVVDVPQEAKVFYAMLRKKQDRAKAKYEEKCQTNRDNASKGGKQKAMNAKARADGETSPKKFKAPTLSQFKNAVKKIVEINDFDDVEPYDVEKFYDELKENSWNFEGMAIQSRNDWEKIIHARFHDPLNYCHDGLRLSYLSILKGVIHGLFVFLTVPAGYLSGLLVSRVFGDTYWYLTAVELVGFGGMMLGGLLMSIWDGFKSRRLTLAAGLGLFGTMAVGMGVSRIFIVYLAFMALYGIALTTVQTTVTTMLQENSEASMRGRVFGLMSSLYSICYPIGMALFGPLADTIPLQWIMISSGGALLLTAGINYWSPWAGSAGYRP